MSRTPCSSRITRSISSIDAPDTRRLSAFRLSAHERNVAPDEFTDFALERGRRRLVDIAQLLRRLPARSEGLRAGFLRRTKLIQTKPLGSDGRHGLLLHEAQHRCADAPQGGRLPHATGAAVGRTKGGIAAYVTPIASLSVTRAFRDHALAAARRNRLVEVLDIGVEPAEIALAVGAVLAQRGNRARLHHFEEIQPGGVAHRRAGRG